MVVFPAHPDLMIKAFMRIVTVYFGILVFPWNANSYTKAMARAKRKQQKHF